jgi:hypothetical protein
LRGFELCLPKVKIPSVTADEYELPGEGDKPEKTVGFEAVILHHHPINAYYSKPYSAKNASPPDCGSLDGVCGVGNPGGLCAECPHNEFGSGKDGNGKACGNRHRLYLLRERKKFPLLLEIPPTSLKKLLDYAQIMTLKGRKLNAIVTAFSLKKGTTKSGTEVSQAIFSCDRVLEPEEYRAVRAMSEQVERYAGSVGFEVENAENTATAEQNTVVDAGNTVEETGFSEAV